MTEVRFYHLQRSGLEASLPIMLERAYERRERVVVMAGSPERVEFLNTHLWVYRPDSFLPHGSARDGMAEAQPIYLTATAENPNRADILMLCDGSAPDEVTAFRLVCTLFDGNDPDALASAREQWRRLKADGRYGMAYYQQDEAGRWQEKSRA